MRATNGIALVTGSDERYADPEITLVATGLRERGLEIEVVAWSDDLDWAAYRLVAVRSTWDYFERLPAFVDWVARVDRLTRLVNPADVIRWNAHKGYLPELHAKGVPTVPTRLVPGTSTTSPTRCASARGTSSSSSWRWTGARARSGAAVVTTRRSAGWPSGWPSGATSSSSRSCPASPRASAPSSSSAGVSPTPCGVPERLDRYADALRDELAPS